MASGSGTSWGGSEEERWAVFQEEGIRTSHLRPLVEQLDQDFEVATSGYAQLQTITDPNERAVVSELIGRSAMGLADNLLEARLAQHALAEMVPATGLPMPKRTTARQHIRDGAWTDMHLAAFVRALESGFDCLAAVAMGVLRIPQPLAKAQLSQFRNLPNLSPATPQVSRGWTDWGRLLAHHETTPPNGWRGWLNGMRNLHVHRAHQSRVLLQRRIAPGEKQLLVVSKTPEEDVMRAARFDHHLRRRPHLADMEDYVLTPQVNELWLEEPAPVTLGGVFDAANLFIEDAAQFLLRWWRYAEKWRSTSFPPPRKAWRPQKTLGPSFGGAAPTGVPFEPFSGQAHPHLQRRLAVAQQLRGSGTMPGAAKPGRILP